MLTDEYESKYIAKEQDIQKKLSECKTLCSKNKSLEKGYAEIYSLKRSLMKVMPNADKKIELAECKMEAMKIKSTFETFQRT